MNRLIYISILISQLLLVACFREEDPVAPYPRGASAEMQIGVGENYENQVYFDVEGNQVVRMNSKMLWDIAFSCSADSTVRLNSGRNMRAAPSNVFELSQITDTTGLQFNWDWSNGKADSTALFGCHNSNRVYVISLGLDEQNQSLGFVKATFEIRADSLYIRYSNLASNDIREAYLVKDGTYNHVHFSFLTHENIEAEPPKTDYDLLFTQYVHYFKEENLAYLVLGVLLNPYNTSAYLSPFEDFSAINSSDLDVALLSNRRDVIGYDWKYFSFGEGTYIVLDKQNYFLQDAAGFFYKLHFIGFYDNAGKKGFPVVAHEKI